MTDIVERVAQAICEAFQQDDGNYESDEPLPRETDWEGWVIEARAAIAEYKSALAEQGMVIVPRESAEAMNTAGCKAMTVANGGTWRLGGAGATWRAMIVAAEEEG